MLNRKKKNEKKLLLDKSTMFVHHLLTVFSSFKKIDNCCEDPLRPISLFCYIAWYLLHRDNHIPPLDSSLYPFFSIGL